MKKYFIMILFLGFIFVLNGCSASSTVERRLTQAGYSLEEIQEFELEEFVTSAEGFMKAYDIFDENQRKVGIIVEFENVKTLDNFIDVEMRDYGLPEEKKYKNLYIETNYHEVFNIATLKNLEDSDLFTTEQIITTTRANTES